MRITANRNPTGFAETVLPGILRIVAAGGGPAALQGAEPRRIEVGMAIKAVEVSAKDIAADRRPKDALQERGFHCFVRYDGKGVATAEFSGDHTLMQANRFVALQGGRLTRLEEIALVRIERHPGDREVEIVLLRCAQLNVHAFLARPKKGEGLLFPVMPLAVAPSRDAYTEAEFFAVLKPEAERVLASYATADDDTLSG